MRKPEPLPGETLLQLAIRNNRDRWGICVENIKSKTPISKQMEVRLLDGDVNTIANNASVRAEIERFVNICLPTSGRTLQDLARLRDYTRERGGMAEIIEIIWPRERDPAGDADVEGFVEPLGVTMIWIPTGASRSLNLGSLLNSIHGEFVWLVPGGTKVPIPETRGRLDRVIRHLAASSRRAIYSDNIASCVLRVSALREQMARGHSLSSDVKDVGHLLREAGHELVGDDDPDLALCELERKYGGWSGPGRNQTREKGHHPSWWQRLFGGGGR
jgi:hypothetical protein